MEHSELMKELNRILAYLFDDDKKRDRETPEKSQDTRVVHGKYKSKNDI